MPPIDDDRLKATLRKVTAVMTADGAEIERLLGVIKERDEEIANLKHDLERALENHAADLTDTATALAGAKRKFLESK